MWQNDIVDIKCALTIDIKRSATSATLVHITDTKILKKNPPAVLPHAQRTQHPINDVVYLVQH